jgi:NADH-quinone oxidoreductase subunit J
MLVGGGEITEMPGSIRPSGIRVAVARVSGIALAMALLIAVGYGIVSGQLNPVQGSAAAFGRGSIQAIGNVLYTDYLLPFELTSVLLLVGMIGAVVLARPPD